MFRNAGHRLFLAAAILAAAISTGPILAGARADTVKTSPSRVGPPVAFANELGAVPILEYHLIGTPEGDWRRTPENFRRDLEMLHKLGYYPVRLLDYVAGRMDVPAGRSPVILTFDDSSEGQFRVVLVNGQPRPDPQSAVGILEDFAGRHPDFPARATFFVLPGISKKLRLFGQPEYWGWKLTYLVSHGYELGNHSLWHQNLAKATPAEAAEQLVLAQRAVAEFVPGYRLRSLALPFGAWPNPRSLARTGTYQNLSYRNEAVLLVGSGPAPSPADRSFDPLALPRIQAGDGTWGPEETLKRLHAKEYGRYISDGDPQIITLPAALAGRLRANLPARAVLVPDPRNVQAGTSGRDAN